MPDGGTSLGAPERKESSRLVLLLSACGSPTVRRLSQLCPPCATPSSNSSLDYRRSDARIVKNGFAASSGVSKSAKVVLGSRLIKSTIQEQRRGRQRPGNFEPACRSGLRCA